VIRNLTSVNLPVTGLLAVPVTLAVNISHAGYAPPACLPAESLFGAVAAAFGLTALELWLLGRAPKG
jgi:hypothetical protein